MIVIKEASVDMYSFSKRMRLRDLDIPKNDYVSKSLMNRLINYIDRKESSNFINIKNPYRILKVIDRLGLLARSGPSDSIIFDRNMRYLKEFLYANKSDWFIIYDAIEFYVNSFEDKVQKRIVED